MGEDRHGGGSKKGGKIKIGFWSEPNNFFIGGRKAQ